MAMAEAGAVEVLPEAGRLFLAFIHTMSGKDTSSLGSSRPMIDDGVVSVDAGIFLVYAAAFFAINWFLRIVVVGPLARAVLTNPSKAMVQKFSQSFLEMVFYGSFTVFGLMIVPTQAWVWPSKHWWIDFRSGSHSVMRDDMRCYYIMYASRYLQGLLSVLIEHRRKDFVEMQVHHWATVVLVCLSYACGWNRIGVIVMLLLDPADVPLHVAKQCKYISDSRKKPQGAAAGPPPPGGSDFWGVAADRLFEFFAVIFFVTRILMYPYICWSAHVESTRYFPKGAAEWTCISLLELLFCLQLYWFWLLIKAVINMISKGGVEDIRSDDEDEDEPAAVATKKKKAN